MLKNDGYWAFEHSSQMCLYHEVNNSFIFTFLPNLPPFTRVIIFSFAETLLLFNRIETFGNNAP